MDYRLLLPIAVLSIVNIISFFIELSAKNREIEMALASDDRLDATLGLLKRDAAEVSLGGANVFIPFVILTFLGSFPNWVVYGAWFFVFTSIIRIPLVHFTRGRDVSTSKIIKKRFMPFVPMLMLAVPLIILLYGYTCLLYTSPSPRDLSTSRMPSSA